MDAMQAKAEAMKVNPGTVPTFAVNFAPSLRSDGRLWLMGEMNGAWVAVQPKAWSTMTFLPDGTPTTADRPKAGSIAPITASGVNLPQMQQHAGEIQTNDAEFGRRLMQASTESRPDRYPEPALPLTNYALAAALVLIPVGLFFGGIVTAVVVRRARS